MSTRVVLADDHSLFRQGLRALLDQQSDMVVVGEADNGRQAVTLARQLRPNVVIMDIAMPELNGVEATRQIRQEFPDVQVLVLSMHADPRYLARALQAGVSGYVLKNAAIQELAAALDAVGRGQSYLSPAVTQALISEYLDHQDLRATDRVEVLSTREREVLQLIAEGKTTRQIAAVLHVSTKTVETHRRNIMEKLGETSIAQLTRFAIREGLTSLDS